MKKLAFGFAIALTLVAAPTLAEAIDLGEGWTFTVEAEVEVSVDYSVPVTEISNSSATNNREWKYIGSLPESGQRTVMVVIGHLNRKWNEGDIVRLLSGPDVPLKVAGPWVYQAFVSQRPERNGKDLAMALEPIAFPDPDSHWELLYKKGGKQFFLSLSGVDDLEWTRYPRVQEIEKQTSARICLLKK